MRTRHALAVALLLGVFALTNTNAQKYQPPKVKFNAKSSSQINVAQEEDFRDFSENTYHIQGAPYSEREVASEKKEIEYGKKYKRKSKNSQSLKKIENKADGRTPSSQKNISSSHSNNSNPPGQTQPEQGIEEGKLFKLQHWKYEKE